MSIVSYMTIVEQLFTELDVLLNNYVFHAYNALAGYLRAPLGLAIVLYIVLMGLSITQGWVKLSMGKGYIRFACAAPAGASRAP